MKKLSLLGIVAAAATLSANTAFANPFAVPEIDALSGLAAIAVVGAAVALIRERTK